MLAQIISTLCQMNEILKWIRRSQSLGRLISDLESQRTITIKKWEQTEISRALYYYQSNDLCIKTGNTLDEYKSLLRVLKKIDNNKADVMDKFLEDLHVKAFLIIHSVFRNDARKNGEFIELYMIDKLKISDEQVQKAFNKKVPDCIKEIMEKNDLELIPFEVSPYRIEFGQRPDPVTKKYGRNPISIIDIDLDVDESTSFNNDEFLSQYEDIIL